jgi:hypothetical protein
MEHTGKRKRTDPPTTPASGGKEKKAKVPFLGDFATCYLNPMTKEFIRGAIPKFKDVDQFRSVGPREAIFRLEFRGRRSDKTQDVKICAFKKMSFDYLFSFYEKGLTMKPRYHIEYGEDEEVETKCFAYFNTISLHGVIPTDQPRHIFIDIDGWKGITAEELVTNFIRVFLQAFFELYHITLTANECAFLKRLVGSHAMGGKNSMHFIAICDLLENQQEHKGFMNYFLRFLHRCPPPPGSDGEFERFRSAMLVPGVIDLNMTKQNATLRCVGSAKLETIEQAGTTTFLMDSASAMLIYFLSPQYTYRDCFVTYRNPRLSHGLLPKIQENEEFDVDLEEILRTRISKTIPSIEMENKEIYDEIQDFLTNPMYVGAGDAKETKEGNLKVTRVVYHASVPPGLDDVIFFYTNCKTCPFSTRAKINRPHKNATLRGKIDIRGCTLSCFAKRCRGQTHHHPIPFELCHTLFYQDLHMDESSLPVLVKRVNLEFEGRIVIEHFNEEQPKPYNHHKVQMVKSHMGTNKTGNAIQFMKTLRRFPGKKKGQYVERRPTSCVICPRISFARDFFRRIRQEGLEADFALYLDTKTTEEVAQTKSVVFVYESIHKLAAAQRTKFDLLFCDEIVTLCNNMVAPTNVHGFCQSKNMTAPNIQAFRQMFQEARRVVLADQDINAKVLQLVLDLTHPRVPIHLAVNLHVPENMQKHFIIYHDPLLDLIEETSYRKMKDIWLEKLKMRIQEGKKIFLVTGSVQFVKKHLLPFLETEHVGHVFYHSNCDCKVANELNDVNAAFGAPNRQVVIISPIMTVGASFDLKDVFDCVFAYATPRSVAIRIIIQMLGRVRFPIENIVHLYIDKVPWELPPAVQRRYLSLEEIKQDLLRKREMLYAHETDPVQKKRLDDWATDFKFLCHVQAYNILETNLNKHDMYRETIKECFRHRFSFQDEPRQRRLLVKKKGNPRPDRSGVVVEELEFGYVENYEDVAHPHHQEFQQFCAIPVLPSWAEFQALNEKKEIQTDVHKESILPKCRLWFKTGFTFNELMDPLLKQKIVFSFWLEAHKNGGIRGISAFVHKAYRNERSLQNIHIRTLGLLYNHGAMVQPAQEFIPHETIHVKLAKRICEQMGLQSITDFDTIIDGATFFDEKKLDSLIKALNAFEVQLTADRMTDRTCKYRGRPENKFKKDPATTITRAMKLLRQHSLNKLCILCRTCQETQCGHKPTQKRQTKKKFGGKEVNVYHYQLVPSLAFHMAQRMALLNRQC